MNPTAHAEGAVPSMATHRPRGWLARKLADPPLCIQAGCDQPPADDSDRCPAHRDDQRARARDWAARRYDQRRRRKRKKCVDCGTDSKLTRCPVCRIRAGQSRTIRSVDTVLDTAGRTRVDPTGRTRYHGKMKRGRQTHASLDEQSIADARQELDKGERGLAEARSEQVQAEGTITRAAAKREALNRLFIARRSIDEILERHRYEEEIERTAPRPRNGRGG